MALQCSNRDCCVMPFVGCPARLWPLLPLARRLAQTDADGVPGQRHRGRRHGRRRGERARRRRCCEGQQAGLERLLRRLVPAEEHALLPAVGDLQHRRYVQNFEIANEELSSTRYLAAADRALRAGRGARAAARRRLWPSPRRLRCRSSCCRCTRARTARACGRTTTRGGRPGPTISTPSACCAWCCRSATSRTSAGLTVAQAQARDRGGAGRSRRALRREDTLVVTAEPRAARAPEAGARACGSTLERIGRSSRAIRPRPSAAVPDQTARGAARRGGARTADQPRRALEERQPLALRSRPGSWWWTFRSPRWRIGSASSRGLESLPEVSQVEIASFARDQRAGCRSAISATSSASSRRWRGWAWRYRGKGSHGCCYQSGEIPAKASRRARRRPRSSPLADQPGQSDHRSAGC